MGMKVPLHGRFVYPFEAASFAPQRGGIDTDVPDSYLWDVHSHKPRQLHLYGFEGKTLLNDMPVMTKGGRNRKASFTATLMMIWFTRFSNKPVTLDNLRYGAMALLPNSILPLQVEDLNEKQAEAAQLLMDAGVPPLLTQGNGLVDTPRFVNGMPHRSEVLFQLKNYPTQPTPVG